MEKEDYKISDVLISDDYAAFVCEEIDEIHRQRKLRPHPPQGKRYLRDWYDRMSEQSVLHSTFFISNITDIWLKKSNLSAEFRNVVNYVCTNALSKYIAKQKK